MPTAPSGVCIFYACAFLFLASPSYALDAKGSWSSRGVGSGGGSCGDYVREDEASRRKYEHWLMGFVSGVNSARSGRVDFSSGVTAQGLAQWAENYCKANPLSSFAEAADALIAELKKKK